MKHSQHGQGRELILTLYSAFGAAIQLGLSPDPQVHPQRQEQVSPHPPLTTKGKTPHSAHTQTQRTMEVSLLDPTATRNQTTSTHGLREAPQHVCEPPPAPPRAPSSP